MSVKPTVKPSNVNPANNSAPILGDAVTSALDRAAPIIGALRIAAVTAKSAIDERNVTRAYMLEVFKSERSPLTFIHIIDGLRADGFKASLTAPSASEKRAVILSHLACGESVNSLPEKLYTFARDNGLVDFAHKINGAKRD